SRSTGSGASATSRRTFLSRFAAQPDPRRESAFYESVCRSSARSKSPSPERRKPMTTPVAVSHTPDLPARSMPQFASVLLLLLAAVFGLGLYGYRLHLGTDLSDEAYYANLVVGRLRAPAGDTGD